MLVVAPFRLLRRDELIRALAERGDDLLGGLPALRNGVEALAGKLGLSGLLASVGKADLGEAAKPHFASLALPEVA